MTVTEQMHSFELMALCGAALGGVYDVLELICTLARGGRSFRAALDLLFGLICAVTIIACGLYLGFSVFRGYVFTAAAVGFTLYMISMGMIVRILCVKLRKIINKV